MTSLLVLTSDPAEGALDDTALARLASEVPGLGEPEWLDERVAAEIPATVDALPLAREALGDRPVDVNLVRSAGRRKRLLIADMDSTIIGQECIDELAELVGLRAEISAVTERAMRGEIAFEGALRERVRLLGGIGTGEIERLLAERITLNPGARTLVATMRRQGAFTALVSGGFTLFTDEIARRAGFDEASANRLVLQDGRLTGSIEEPILGRAAKRERLAALRQRLDLPTEATLAVGDGANDLDMIGAAGLGVAYRAKPAVAAAADASIDHGDLTALLYLQGFRSAEFVRP